MVKSVLGVNHQGLRDWLFQRVTAIVMLAYILIVVGFIIMHSPVTFVVWQQFFNLVTIKVATLLFILCLLYHTWVGIWTVATDYINPWGVRLLFHSIVALLLIACFFWGTHILWGV